MTTLYVLEAASYREATTHQVIACAHKLMAQQFRKGSPVLSAPARTREFLSIHLGGLDHEIFGCLFLDNRHRLICAENLFRGTIVSPGDRC